MTSINVGGLDESVKRRLAEQAREHGRSMEAEARDILTRGVSRPHIGSALLQVARNAEGVDQLQIRDHIEPARSADFE